MVVTDNDSLAYQPFSYQTSKGSVIRIFRSNRLATTLRGNRASLFLAKISSADGVGAQQIMGVEIVFCTAYPEHAVKSYEVQALDYLLKPIPIERFLAAANRAQSQRYPAEHNQPNEAIEPGQSQIFIKSGTQIHQVDTDKISFIKKDGHYIVFKISGRELLSRMTFSQLLELLPTKDFIQVHRSYVVAVKKIEVIQKQFIQIEDKEVPIGDAFKKEFFQRVKFIGN